MAHTKQADQPCSGLHLAHRSARAATVARGHPAPAPGPAQSRAGCHAMLRLAPAPPREYTQHRNGSASRKQQRIEPARHQNYAASRHCHCASSKRRCAARVLELVERTAQPREVRVAPQPGPAQAATVEVDQEDFLIAAQQDVVRVEVGVAQPVVVEAADAASDRRPAAKAQLACVAAAAQASCVSGKQLGDQVAAIERALAQVARGHGHRHRQSRGLQLQVQPQLPHRSRCVLTQPQVAIRVEASRPARRAGSGAARSGDRHARTDQRRATAARLADGAARDRASSRDRTRTILASTSLSALETAHPAHRAVREARSSAASERRRAQRRSVYSAPQ